LLWLTLSCWSCPESDRSARISGAAAALDPLSLADPAIDGHLVVDGHVKVDPSMATWWKMATWSSRPR